MLSDTGPKALKAAAYCRVSTDHKDQVNSLTNQKRYFEEYINRNPLWKLTEIYADEGITGTSTKKRDAFNRMITDAGHHKFDLILTKEISRFARNTLDSIFYTRKLKDLGIGVIFLNDNINTLDSDAELRLTIMASIAQEESRKTSDRVKWGQKRRMEQGVVFGHSMLGYDIKDGKMTVNEEGAKIVSLIFHKFVNEGKGTYTIAKELEEDRITPHHYMKKWSNTVILRILQNEKYAGDLIQKKTFTPSYLSHEKKYNKGEEDLVILRNHHEPIIDKELFNKAQAELERRRFKQGHGTRYSNRYCFSGKLKCGFCGCAFVSRTKKRKDGSIYRAWRCYEAANYGKPHLNSQNKPVGCYGRQINNEDLMFLMSLVVKELPLDKEKILNDLVKTITSAILLDSHESNLKKIQDKLDWFVSKKQRLIELYLNSEISKPDFQILKDKYEGNIALLAAEQNLLREKTEVDRNQGLIQDITKTLKGITDGNIQDEYFYRSLLHKIVIYDRRHMDVYLNRVPSKWSFLISDSVKPHEGQF